MTGYIGIGGKAKKVNSLYVGIGGKAKKVIKGYVGVGGKAKLWYSAQKLWTWEKHNIDTTTVYVEVIGDETSRTQSSSFSSGSTYSINSNTKKFSVNQNVPIALSSYGANTAPGKYVASWTSYSGTYSATTIYKVITARYSAGRLYLTLQPISYEAQTQQSMGSLIGTVTDIDITTYPTDGPQDGYWYVLTEIPSFTYSGSYNSDIVEMDGRYYLLLELTGSGVLALGNTVSADVWICGGGSVGGNPSTINDYAYGYGGGAGAYAASVTGANIKDIVVTIGVGGTVYGNPSATGITGDISLSVNNIASVSGYYDWRANCHGGTGGGLVYGATYTDVTGDGLSKLPFNSNYFTYPYCDGGGAGGYYRSSSKRYNGGAGGTNGGNGGSYSSGGYAGGAGGGHYGGAGGYSAQPGSNATGYGSGGGGGGNDYNEGTSDGGSGYQGVCFIRIPL